MGVRLEPGLVAEIGTACTPRTSPARCRSYPVHVDRAVRPTSRRRDDAADLPRPRRHRGDAVVERGRGGAARRARGAKGHPSGIPATGRARRGEAGHAPAGRAEQPWTRWTWSPRRSTGSWTRSGVCGSLRSTASRRAANRPSRRRTRRSWRHGGNYAGESTRRERTCARNASSPALRPNGLRASNLPSFLLRGARLEQADVWVRDDGPRARPRPAAVRRGQHHRARRRTTGRRGATSSRDGYRAALDAPAACARRGRSRSPRSLPGRSRSSRPAKAGVRNVRLRSPRPVSWPPHRLRTSTTIRSSQSSSRSRRSSVPERSRVCRSRRRRRRCTARSSLHGSSPSILSVSGPVATSVDGRIAAQAVDGAGRVTILDPSGAPVRTIAAHDGAQIHGCGVHARRGEPDHHRRRWLAARVGCGARVPRVERHDAGDAGGTTLDATGSLVAARWPEADRVVVADVDTGHEARTFMAVPDQSLAALSANGARLAISTTGGSGVEAGRMFRWSETVTVRRSRRRGGGDQRRAVVGPDGRLLSGGAYVWDTTTGELVHTAWEHDATVIDSAWSSDGARLVTAGGSDGTAKVWTFSPGSAPLSHCPQPVPPPARSPMSRSRPTGGRS